MAAKMETIVRLRVENAVAPLKQSAERTEALIKALGIAESNLRLFHALSERLSALDEPVPLEDFYQGLLGAECVIREGLGLQPSAEARADDEKIGFGNRTVEDPETFSTDIVFPNGVFRPVETPSREEGGDDA